MRSFARPLLAALFVLLLASAGRAADWQGWTPGLQRARSTGKPVLVDVYTDWCGWCKRMDREVYARREVDAYLSSHFVTVRLNAESGELAAWRGKNYSARSLAEAFGVNGYPTTVFLDASGNKLVNVPGYIPADRFLLLLRFIGDGHMAKQESWEDYLKQAQREH